MRRDVVHSVALGLCGAVWFVFAALTGICLAVPLLMGDGWCADPLNDSAYGRLTWSVVPFGPRCTFDTQVEEPSLWWTVAILVVVVGGLLLVRAAVKMWRAGGHRVGVVTNLDQAVDATR